MNKKRNAANTFAKECIATALFKLMKEKKYEDITITDIANTAGVSRVTYYRNFYSKDDIIIHYLDELGYQFQQETKHLHPATEPHACALSLFRYWLRYSDVLLCLYEARLGYMLLDHLNQPISQFAVTTREKYEACFFVGSMHNMLVEWIKGGTKETPEEMADIVCNLLRRSISLPAIENGQHPIMKD